MAPQSAEEALRPLPAGYRELYEKVLRAASADDRVRALWLSGSLARGVADAGSDLDIIIAVGSDDFAGFTAGWREWLTAITPTVLARELPRLPGSWHCLTPECLRLDIVTERSGSPTPVLRTRLLILDKDGTAAAPDDEPDPGPGPDPARIAGLTEEFLRQQAIFPAAVVGRNDWLLGVDAVQNVHLMLYELFVAANQPLPPMGLKQWSAKLTAGQRRVLTELRLPAAGRDSVIDAMRAAAWAYRQAAAGIHAANGVEWPGELDAAVTRYQQATLGWDW
jgi:Nucleotidyltransferase domain